MTIEEMRQHEWVVSWSGGKDSTATIILMHEYNIPIKEIIYVRMMFNNELPATLPIMTNFVDASKKFLKVGDIKSRLSHRLEVLKILAKKFFIEANMQKKMVKNMVCQILCVADVK